MTNTRNLKEGGFTEESLQKAAKLLEVLDEKEKAVIPFLFEVSDYSEIGEALGISSEQVKALIGNIVKKLRKVSRG